MRTEFLLRLFIGLFALIFASTVGAEQTIAESLVAEGQRIYLEGMGVSGKAIRALVQGDVPLSGTQMTCQSCHGRSGMGTIESGEIPPAIAGPFLYSPDIRTRTQRRRPAYSDKTLARSLIQGIDASGHPLNPLMPRYQLGKRDTAALIAYLRQLGTTESPGVSPTSLRVATLIAGDVDPVVERAELDIIEAFVAARNRSGPQRLRGGHSPNDIKETFRKWSHDIWRISGPPDSWRAQIEKLYRKRPVFALLGGLASGSWEAVNDFCEEKQMPCILPDIDLPPVDTNGFYSFYFSRGLRLEAEIVSSELKSKGLGANVLSIVSSGNRNASAVEVATVFEQTHKRQGGQVRTLDLQRDTNPDQILAKIMEHKTSAVVLWLNVDWIRRLADAGLGSEGPPMFLSSTMLGASWDGIPAVLRSRTQVVHLTALPNEPDPALQRFRAWAIGQRLKLQETRHQALAYFACFAFANGVKHTGLYLSRDYVLDLLNHSSKLSAYLPLYTRAGITPGQRILSRGGYLVDLAGRSKPTWVVP